MLSVEQMGAETVLINLKSEELQLHSAKAAQITHVVRLFLIELTKVLVSQILRATMFKVNNHLKHANYFKQCCTVRQ